MAILVKLMHSAPQSAIETLFKVPVLAISHFDLFISY